MTPHDLSIACDRAIMVSLIVGSCGYDSSPSAGFPRCGGCDAGHRAAVPGCGAGHGVNSRRSERGQWRVARGKLPRLRGEEMERARYIAIEGPIGAGKTTLANLLVERMGGRLVSESVDENPFLGSFYEDRRKHAFQTQLFFLLSRFQQQQGLFQQDLFDQV